MIVPVPLGNHLERQQFLEDRYGLFERTTLIMAVHERNRFDHIHPQLCRKHSVQRAKKTLYSSKVCVAANRFLPGSSTPCTFLNKLISSKSSGVKVFATFSVSR